MIRPASFTSLNDLLQQRAKEPRGQWRFLRNRGREEQVLTYRELERRAAVVASALRKANCGTGDRVVLLFQTGSAFLEAFFGCSFGGAVAVPLNPPRPNRKKERYQAVLEDAQCKHILTDRTTAHSLREALPPGVQLLVVEELADEPLTQIHQATLDDLVFLQYTSGSTGTPKGVMISHHNLLANLEVIRESGQLGNDVYVNWLPFFHDMGLIFTLLSPLYTNDLSVHLAPSEFMQRPLTWLNAIDHYRGTVCGGPNFAFEQCMRLPAEQIAALDLSCWRGAFTGAEPIRAETLERFAETFAPAQFQPKFFYPCYGLAEATLMVSGGGLDETYRVKQLDRKALNEHRVMAADYGARFVDCGMPRPGFDLKIVNPATQAALPEGEIGEIWVAGDSVARGYWQRAEATAQTFQNQLRDGAGHPSYLATGDLGFLSDGRLYVTGRLKDLIIIRGRNYVPSDIENTAWQAFAHLHRDGAAAFTVADKDQERLILVQEVMRGKQNDFDWAAAGEAMRSAISEQQELQLHEVVFLKQGALPKTSSGKVQRAACRKLYLEHQLPALYVWPRRDTPKTSPKPSSELKAWLKQQVAERLGLEPETIDEGQPLALYGMDSPTALGLLGDLETLVERELSPTLVYEYPTIRDLVGYLNGDQPAAKVHQQAQQEPIAVVGAACRFPGAPNLEAFWQLLSAGKDAITEVPAERWSVEDHYDPQPQTPDKMITRFGGFLDGIDQFDAKLFDISPQEAENMDPQQRHLLEVTWQAMDHTGFGVDHFRGSQTGVFVGVARSDYSMLQVNREGGRNAYAGIGSATSIAANRISYTFDLRGPSFAIDTACSSALVALDRACRSLEQGECETALAGAVNCILTPELTTALSQAGMMSPDGRCFAFDARANGYVRAEGCAMVVLKPLAKAIRDGNHVMGVIKGTAVNQDGRGNGLTAPNGRAQKEVLRTALARANATPQHIHYIEAHGTGTALGDPIEMDALKEVLTADRDVQNPCWVGSVKTNIGHTETVAGLAGLLKVLLAMRAERIPKQLHFQSLNPHIKLDGALLRIATEPLAWAKGEQPRLAGISSFGIGGTNAHVIVAEPPRFEAPPATQPLAVISLSAATSGSLSEAQTQLTHALAEGTFSIAEVATTLEKGRRVFPYRAAWLADSQATAAKPDRVIYGEASKQPPNLAFLFPGQGSQYPGMGAALYATEPVYRQAVDCCADLLKPHLDLDLRCLLTQAYIHQANAEALMTQTRIAQPTLFVVSFAAAQLWQARGLNPSAMMGHSIGEFVAACLSGVFSLEAALKLVAHRGQLMQSMPEGAMLAVPLSEAELLPLMGEDLDLAAINSSKRCVISGPHAVIDAFSQRLKERGVVSQRLVTSHAFHSRMMEPILIPFQTAVAQAEPQAPRQPFISSLTGDWITDQQAQNPEYWAKQLRGCVRFAPGLLVLAQTSNCLLEVGPGETLCKLGGGILGSSQDVAFVHSLPGPKRVGADVRTFLEAAAKLWVRGVLLTLNPEARHKRAALPGLVMSPQRYWVERGPENPKPKASVRLKDMQDWFSVPTWQQVPPVPVQPWQTGATLLLHDGSDTADCLQRQLQQNGDRVVSVRIGETFGGNGAVFTLNPHNPEDYRALVQRLSEQQVTLTRIAHCWLAKNEREAVEQTLATGFFSCIYLLQALKSHQLRFLAITRNVFAVDRFDHQHPEKATILGPITVMRREYPELEAGHLDLASDASAEEACAQILQSLQLEELPATEAARGRARWQRHFTPVALPNRKSPEPLRTDGVYLITGGLGAVGRAIALFLAQRVQANLVLVGRTALPKRKDWDQFTEANDAEMYARIEALRQMEAAGAQVLCLQADVTCEAGMRDLVAKAKQHFQAIDGVIHAAGIPGDGMIRLKDATQAHKVLAPKVEGSLVLERVFKDQQPDFIVYCSSVFALAGEFGQVDYCAANTFQDHLAEALDRPQSRRISLSWGAWRDGGMAARMNLSPTLRDIHQHQLRLGLSTAEGGEAFGRAIAFGHNRIAICTQDLKAMLQAYETMTTQTQQVTLPVKKRERTSEKPFQGPQGETEMTIAAIWSELTGVDPVGRDDHFFELGGDSLVATQMFSQVEGALGAAPDMALFYENPTVAGIAAQFVAGETQAAADIVRVSRSAPLPLSLAQHRLWFDCQRRGETTLYNLPGRVTLHGAIDRAGFADAFLRVVKKHESLRTRFVAREGQPFQVIEPATDHGIRFTDLSESENPEQSLAQIQQTEANHLFHLDQLPLYRVHLVRLTANHHELFLNMHHIIFDGWSESVLLKDWMAAYQNQNLKPLQVQYADYAAWQQQQLTSESMREQKAWWLSQLQGASRLLLPKDTDGVRPECQHRVVLSLEQTNRVRSFAARQQQTAYSLAMAAYLLTLHSKTGQRDLVLGLDFANRQSSAVQQMIGFFVNPMPLRVQVKAEDRLCDFAQRLRQQMIAAEQRQGVPFNQLVEALNSDTREPLPLIQSIFVQQNVDFQAVQQGELTWTLQRDAPLCKFETAVFVTENEHGLALLFTSGAGIFEPASLERIANETVNMLNLLVTQPNQPIFEISDLTSNKNPKKALPAALRKRPKTRDS